MTHRPPRESDLPGAILHDDCDDCARRVRDLGCGLDPPTFTRMWDRMIAVEYEHKGSYLGDNEAALGRHLYLISLLMQRNPHSFKPFRIGQPFRISQEYDV